MGTPGQGAQGRGGWAKGTSVRDGRTSRVPMRTFPLPWDLQHGDKAVQGSPSHGWRLPWVCHHGDKAKEPSVARVPFRWGPLIGTWHGRLSVMQMGFEGQRWSLRWDLILGVQTQGSSETRVGSERQQWSSRWNLPCDDKARGSFGNGMGYEMEASPWSQSKRTICV